MKAPSVANRLRSISTIFSITIVVLCIVTSAAAQRRYKVSEVVLPGGTTSTASGINAFGQVTGCSDSSEHTGVMHAYLYGHRHIVDLGTLPTAEQSCGTAINNAGHVVGDSDNHVFIYSNGRLNGVSGLSEASANAISGFDHIVGADQVGRNFPFLLSGGIETNLGTLPGDQFGEAFGINDFDQIVGRTFSSTSPGITDYHGFIWFRGSIFPIGNLPGGNQSIGRAINGFGQITGYANVNAVSPAAPFHAFLDNRGKLTDLGTLPGGHTSHGLAINDRGQVVGEADTASSAFPFHAFLYERGRMIDLNRLIPRKSGWTLNSADGINNAGVIVGQGTINGSTRGFVLTPVEKEREH